MVRSTPTPGPNEVTLDAVPRNDMPRGDILRSDIPRELSDASLQECQRVCLIEGSRPQISSETTNLLRRRLRAAAGFLFLAFGAFFVWQLAGGAEASSRDGLPFYLHFATVVVLASSFGLLCRKCAIPLAVLRGYELAIFGLPVAYFLVAQYDIFDIISRKGFLPSPLAPWMGTIFIYAMYIPNTWRRAAIVIGIMCACPVVLIVFMWTNNPVFTEALAQNHSIVIEVVIMMGVTFLASTYATHMIGGLRREAFEARQLGQYRLCRLIGSGGMGDVYLAEHQMMKRPCAIKLIRPGKANDPHALARFEREVRATAKLSHWNTIEIFDYGRTDDGTFYYVMEYLPGLSLAELVEKHGPLPPARAVHLLTQACDALAEAHAAGLIHRDIKPGNIFSAQRGGVYDVAKLLDFGLAKPISPDSASLMLTQEGTITGSPLFMSPEQALGDHEPDARSDIYSLGGVAYFVLTGLPPFEGERALKVILAHAHQEVVPPSRHRSEIPADLEQIVLRCLAKNPADRYPDVVSLRRALGECSAAGGWTAEDAAEWWQANGTADQHAVEMAPAAI